MKQFSKIALVSLAAAALVACGGGGGGQASAPTPSTPAPAAPSTAIVTYVTPATYAAGGPERAAYDLLNAERGRCGFGLLAQNSKLDVAAAAHVKYMITNATVSHSEDSTLPDFYAADIVSRAKKAGYSPLNDYSGEVIAASFGAPAADSSLAVKAAYQLFGGPYHALSMFAGSRDVGTAFARGVPDQFGSISSRFIFTMGTQAGLADQVAGLSTFPCEGTAGVLATNFGETPSPFPSEQNAQWGQPIVVSGSSDLSVSSATITGPKGSVALKAVYGGVASPVAKADPNGRFGAGKVAIIPEVLDANSSYSVVIAGNEAGKAFTKSFTFMTGSF